MRYKRRKDGRYSTRISTGKYTADGKLITKTIYARTITELEAKKAEMQVDVKRGMYADDAGRTFGSVADDWLRAEKSGLEAKTVRKYTATVETLLKPLRGVRIKALTRADVVACLAGQNAHPDNQRMMRMVVNAVLESAIDNGIVYKNVARNIKQKIAPAAEKRPLTAYEKRILDSVEWSPMQAAFLLILRYFGLRSGEALALMPSDIDFDAGCIHVRRAVTFAGSTTAIKAPKSAAGVRDVDAPEGVLSRLHLFVDACPTMYLFTGRNGSLMSHSTYRRFWSGIYQRIDEASGGRERMEPVRLTPHIFRHSYTCDLIDAGVSVKEAQRLLGHASVSVTLNIYAHHTETARQQTRSKLSALLSDCCQNGSETA